MRDVQYCHNLFHVVQSFFDYQSDVCPCNSTLILELPMQKLLTLFLALQKQPNAQLAQLGWGRLDGEQHFIGILAAENPYLVQVRGFLFLKSIKPMHM